MGNWRLRRRVRQDSNLDHRPWVIYLRSEGNFDPNMGVKEIGREIITISRPILKSRDVLSYSFSLLGSTILNVPTRCTMDCQYSSLMVIRKS